MDDSDFLCPLCCEELDISDRNFYPCKCGYQVCMWCWHRIRESESGLCPACRTPYGDDPHEFSAVDVEEVLKANKEKAAAEKKPKEGTEDRTALANMRVIRRNLVYAVGLPPLSEEVLRKSDYFGQYGKINKIVLNRNNPPAGDARRASSSAYVTFFHKEDTLSCILALDGFYMDNRNIRASYGTSKYCSAFIKNVRCNNPECTYLHSMGEKEDTFTKQEIQAGYVTSGRDVLERLQQTGARRKVGGGGPSGTGKASSTPLFPPPTYEEPPKPPSLVPLVRAQPKRSVSVSAGSSPPRAGSAGSAGGIMTRSKSLATAASVVAGMHAPEPTAAPPPRTTTLTPLTPLKPRATTKTKVLLQPPPPPPQDQVVARKVQQQAVPKAQEDIIIGGTVIGGAPIGGAGLGGLGAGGGGGLQPAVGGSSLLGGDVIGGGSRLTGLGGEVYNGDLHGRPSAIGGDKWNSGSLLGSNGDLNGMGGGSSFGAIGSGSIGGSAIGGGFDGGPSNNVGTSNLANMLGISLPSGSGSLSNDTSNPFLHPSAIGAPPLTGGGIGNSGSSFGGGTIGGAIGRSSMQHNLSTNLSHAGGGGGAIGTIGSGAIGPARGGGVIGAPGSTSTPIGGMAIGGGGQQNDIALLQSLLPGVHITSGHGQQSAPGDSNFGSVGSNNWSGQQQQQQNGKTWNGNSGGGGFHTAPGGGVIGGVAIGGGKQQQQQQQQQQNSAQQQKNRNNIW